MKMKRFLSLLLALTLTVGLLPLSAASAELDSSIEAEPDSSLSEPVSEPPEAAEPDASTPAVRTPATKAVTASGTCGNNLTWTLTDDGTLTISGTGDMADYSFASFVPWYSNRSGIKKAVIEKGITSIGVRAFYGCGSLTSITIPDSVTSIDGYAFYNCTSLKEITIPNSVTSIGDFAFYNCDSLTSITIPNSVTSIGDYAFVYCARLTNVTIPASVTSIGDYAFYGCGRLTSITIPDSVTSIGEHAFSGCCSLKEITIPDSVTSIGDYAFHDCTSLTGITIPDSVTSIGVGVLAGCTGLNGIYVDENNPNYADIDGVLYNKDYTELNSYPGAYSSSYKIPDSVTSIGDGAFSGCRSLKEITIPDRITSIGNSAFYNCTSLKEITIPDGVTSIGTGAFWNCTSLTSITIPDGVTSIGYNAFYYCTSLTSVTIGNSVTGIGDYAFCDCTSLTSITFKGMVPPTIDSNAFYNVTATAYYPGGEAWTEDVRQNYGGNLTWVEYTPVDSAFAGGSGTEADPYIIKTKEHLNNVRNHLDACFRMEADIVFADADFAQGGDFYNNGTGWQPIGTDYSAYFKGSFDGNGHRITGIKTNAVSQSNAYIGLFGYAANATIKNLDLVDCDIRAESGSASVGGIAGALVGGTIENCYYTGDIWAVAQYGTYAGGIVGYVGNGSSSVADCCNTGTVYAKTLESSAFVGGIAGNIYSGGDIRISGCYNAGDITAVANTADANAYAGGIVGYLYDADIINCYNTATVAAKDSVSSYAGGIVGWLYSYGTVTNAYNVGAVQVECEGVSGHTGGIAGNAYGEITNAYYLNSMDRGTGSGTDTATCCTDAQMRQQATYAGFDFGKVWMMSTSAKYPKLRAFMTTNDYEIVDGKIYYYGENGELAEDGKHDFSEDGYITGNNVFITINNNTYYIVNNTIVTNYYIIDNRVYYFGDDGVQTEDGKHQFSPDGYITGSNIFITINNNTYYIVNNTIVTNYHIIDNRVYYFGEDGALSDDGKHDFSEDGYITGNNVFITINNNTYYIVNNTIVTNYYIIDNRVYYFGEDGALSDDGEHDFSEDGYITGNNVFITINNNTYYIVNNTIITNYYIIDNRVYYFGEDGALSDDGKHDFSEDGYITGNNVFITINNNTYYIVNNTIVTNYYIIDNRVYYFGDDGVQTEDGKHQFSPDGYITGSNIFITVNNNIYCIVNNIIVTNYHIIDNRIYYFGSDGAMTGDGKHQFSPDGYILGDRIFVTVNNSEYYLINNVIAVPVAVILTNLPAKLHYAKGQDALDVTGGCVTICFENDIQESFVLAESMVTGFDNTKAGKQTLTVNYCGKTVTYDVEIFIPGDADSNESINILDVMTIINIITGVLQPTDSLHARADLNGDGTVNILDAMALINQITGA